MIFKFFILHISSVYFLQNDQNNAFETCEISLKVLKRYYGMSSWMFWTTFAEVHLK